jgi:hypothetical protein
MVFNRKMAQKMESQEAGVDGGIALQENKP